MKTLITLILSFVKINFLKFTSLLLLLACVNTYAQIPHQEQINNREGFFNYYYKNPDSAAFFAAKLMKDPLGAPYLRDAVHSDLHTVFVVKFREIIKKANEEESVKRNKLFNEYEFNINFDKMTDVVYATIQKMADSSNKELAAYTNPLYTWLNILKAKHNLQLTTQLTETFIANDLASPDLFENCAARYALLIYGEVAQMEGMEALSNKLLLTTINKLATLQITDDANRLADGVLEKRAWYRFVYSWANYYMAQRLSKTDNTAAGKYLGIAARYSPDVCDLGRPNDYFADKKLLADREDRSFGNEYLDYLESTSDKRSTLVQLTEMAIRQPDKYKAKLKAFYIANTIDKQMFGNYWDNAVSATLSPATIAKIKMPDGSVFNTTVNGKWVLLDFWGTWCMPCREEHPDLQKLYMDTKEHFFDKLKIVTIACHDTEKSVKAYMGEFNYSFPVALADSNIIKTFNVLGYPTKVLISPQGKFLKVPYGVDWVAFVKAYVGID